MVKPPETKVSIPNVAWRKGRPRFVPSAAQRAMGYKGEDLKTRAGVWFSFEQACAWAKKRAEEIAHRREIKARIGRMPPRPRARVVTLASLFEQWLDQDRMKAAPENPRHKASKVLSPTTVAGYRIHTRVIERDAAELYLAPIEALTKPILFGFYESMSRLHGPASAAAMIRVISAAISYGMRRGLCSFALNPCSNLGMEQTTPRLRAGEPEEMAHLIAAADALGRPEIGDAITLGLWTGQRQKDRLALMDRGLTHGRRIFRQSKTGAIVAIRETPRLEARLAAARHRRSEAKLQLLEIVIDEKRGRPFQHSHYTHLFLAVRLVATHGLFQRGNALIAPVAEQAARSVEKYFGQIQAMGERELKRFTTGAVPDSDWIIRPMASLEDFRDQDLRDTAVTWLARAGCTIPEICSITGHSHQSANQIMRHYLAAHPEMADHAMAKMESWFENEAGMRET